MTMYDLLSVITSLPTVMKKEVNDISYMDDSMPYLVKYVDTYPRSRYPEIGSKFPSSHRGCPDLSVPFRTRFGMKKYQQTL